MNRIKISPLAALELEAKSEVDPRQVGFWQNQLDSAFRRRSEGQFSLFVPMHYQNTYAYPLVIWLHRDGSDCSEISELMPRVSSRNHVGIAPQSGYSHNSPIAWPSSEESVEAAYESVMAAVDQAKLRFNINSRRIILAGAGTGGTMAFRIAFERPDVFGGVISIDGPMETEHVPLRDWERCRELPVLLPAFGRQAVTRRMTSAIICVCFTLPDSRQQFVSIQAKQNSRTRFSLMLIAGSWNRLARPFCRQ